MQSSLSFYGLTVLIASLLVTGCSRGGGAKTPPVATPVTFGVPGDQRPGFLYGGASDRGVVLIAGDADTNAWSPLAGELAQLGYRVLVIARPSGDGAAAARAAGAELARRGTDRVVYVGSHASTAAALAAAGDGAAGAAALNPAAEPDPIPAAGMPSVPLLALASLADTASSGLAQRMYSAAGEPRTLALYPAREPAPAVFAAPSGELKAAFLDFLRSAFEPLSARAR